jgi:geranylgeranyl diphosphate synthase type 3
VLTETRGIAMFQFGLMQLLSDNKADFTPLTNTLSLYFQIRNDYCNLHVEQVTSKLPFLDGEVVHAFKLDAMKVQMALI